ncbi:MAG: hypothetical protein KF838_12250 [Phycisphaeraceae bacterium]|nr:MAG: hypothetical protein KF838_12250 [Phycisphaeraceae bacterium]
MMLRFIVVGCVAAQSAAALSPISEEFRSSYNARYGTALSGSDLLAIRISNDYLWKAGDEPRYSFIGSFTAERNGFGLYLDPGVASNRVQLFPARPMLGYAPGPSIDLSGLVANTTFGFYMNTSIFSFIRVTEPYLNGPTEPSYGGGPGQDYVWTFPTPVPGTFIMGWEDWHGDGGDHADLIIEVTGMRPIPAPATCVVILASAVMHRRRRA